MEQRFIDKVVITTGAAGGIGKAVAKRFYDEGAKVVMLDMRKEWVDSVVEAFGMDPERVIVASHFDTSDRVYDGLYVWLIVPAGALPETPDAFCSTADLLRDAFWATITLSEGKNAQLYLHIFEVDEETLANAEGEAVTFAQLREVALARPADLDGYHVDLLLTAMSFGSQWEGEEEPSLDPMRPQDVGGSIARSRSWRYSEE